MNNDYKKIAIFVILVTLAAIIWRERFSGKNTGDIPSASEENPFVDIQEVPLKLDSFYIPDLQPEDILEDPTKDSSWGRDPFKGKKE